MSGRRMILLLCQAALPMREVEEGAAVTRQVERTKLKGGNYAACKVGMDSADAVGRGRAGGAGDGVSRSGARRRCPLIKYNGNGRDYWEHPPADWFMGDETAQQHGTHPYPGQPLPTPHDELVSLVKDNIKLQPGFHIEILADQLDCARQMVFGPDNTLYVGCWTDHVFALKKQGDTWVSKVIIKGLRQPTGIGFYNGNLYVTDIDKIYRYKDIANNLDNPKGEVVYSDFPPYTSHGWKYMVADPQAPAGSTFRSARPATSA